MYYLVFDDGEVEIDLSVIEEYPLLKHWYQEHNWPPKARIEAYSNLEIEEVLKFFEDSNGVAACNYNNGQELCDIDYEVYHPYEGDWGREYNKLSLKFSAFYPCQQQNKQLLSLHLHSSKEKAMRDPILKGNYALLAYEDKWIRSNLTPDELVQDAKQCPVSYYPISCKRILEKLNGHQMSFIIDSRNKVIELFDPNGKTNKYEFVVYWLEKLAKGLKYKFVPVEEGHIYPQSNATGSWEDRVKNSCVVWSFYYLWLRIHNPNIDRKTILKYLCEMKLEEIEKRLPHITNALMD